MDEKPATTPRLIDFAEVTRLTSLRKNSIYYAIKRGEFRPIKIRRKTVFAEAEILAWVSARISSNQGI